MIASYEYAACLTLPIHTIRQDVPPPWGCPGFVDRLTLSVIS